MNKPDQDGSSATSLDEAKAKAVAASQRMGPRGLISEAEIEKLQNDIPDLFPAYAELIKNRITEAYSQDAGHQRFFRGDYTGIDRRYYAIYDSDKDGRLMVRIATNAGVVFVGDDVTTVIGFYGELFGLDMPKQFPEALRRLRKSADDKVGKRTPKEEAEAWKAVKRELKREIGKAVFSNGEPEVQTFRTANEILEKVGVTLPKNTFGEILREWRDENPYVGYPLEETERISCGFYVREKRIGKPRKGKGWPSKWELTLVTGDRYREYSDQYRKAEKAKREEFERFPKTDQTTEIWGLMRKEIARET
jgi:hypothetical protein